MKIVNVIISEEINAVAPHLKVLKLQARITNSPTAPGLQQLIVDLANKMRGEYTLPDINKRPGIFATRNVYKSLGKDPNRYRPSQEQLMRRIVNGKELYFVNNAVDIFNYISLFSGYSIGAFDLEKIEGDTLTLGVGKKEEPYEGIGRGTLNIEHLPVYRDLVGGIGTPTSDNERTKVSLDTTVLLVCFNIYGEEIPTETVRNLSETALKDFCKATEFNWQLIDKNGCTDLA